ncbi:HBL/NHE enterotoxin family protein [Streptomyces spiramyceticus]|uniref:HBL/NHE enterotoxin family protein n=1 Tax=Streptomyces spiramyceticus TaxID=299717 RepID=UPI00237BF159|nr:HBL/NHE enterotoxin family protein [Streptomyces spiramyceticus]
MSTTTTPAKATNPAGSLHQGLQTKGTKLAAIQTYAKSLEAQGHAVFRPDLVPQTVQDKLNQTLDQAKIDAAELLGQTMSQADHTLSAVEDFCISHKNLVDRFRHENNPERIRDDIEKMRTAIEGAPGATGYAQEAEKLKKALENARQKFSGHAVVFQDSAGAIRIAIEVQQKTLDRLDVELADLEKKIQAAVKKLVEGGVLAAGGVVVFAIGACMGPWGAPLMIAGGVLVVIGAGKIADAVYTMISLQKQKEQRLRDKAAVQADKTQLEAFKKTLEELSTKAAEAASAAQDMKMAWGGLQSQLGRMARRLNTPKDIKDIADSADVRAADEWRKKLETQTSVIRKQFDGDVVTNTKKQTSEIMEELVGTKA